MPDIVDSATRSRMMSGIRGKDTKPELEVRRFLHQLGFRFRLQDPRLPGRPDVVLSQYRTVVFVHGCFWHQHAGCRLATKPGTNVEFWKDKLGANVKRDQRNEARLTELGWRSLTIWECELGDLVALPGRIRGQPDSSPSIT